MLLFILVAIFAGTAVAFKVYGSLLVSLEYNVTFRKMNTDFSHFLLVATAIGAGLLIATVAVLVVIFFS